MLEKVPLSYYILAAVFNFISCTAITIGVLKSNKDSRVVKLFAVFTAELAIWSFFYAIWLATPNPKLAEFFVRTCMLPVTFMPASFLHFVSELTKKKLLPIIHRINYAIGIIFATTVYTRLFAVPVQEPFFSIRIWPMAGPIFSLHLLHFIGNIVVGHIFMFQVLKTDFGMLRKQIVAIFWGSVIAFIAGPSSYLPWYRVPAPPVLHPLVSLYVAVYAYGIVRYQLMEIQHLVRKTVAFAGLVAFSVLTMVFLPKLILCDFLGTPRIWADFTGAVVIVITYGKFHRWIIEITENWLFQKKYDYKDLLRKFTDEVMVVLDLKRVGQMTVNTLIDTVKLDTCTLLLLNKDTRKYEIAAAKGLENQKLVFDEQEQFITFLRETHEPIWLDGKVQYPETLTSRAKELKARLCIPLHLHQDLIGVLCLGKKKSDEEFSKDDMDILSNLVAKNLAVALTNALQSDELDKTRAEAAQKEKLAVIGTLSAGINHEICNPLGIVKAQCEAFLLDAEDGILVGKSQQDVLERTSNIMRVALKQIDRATAITQKLSNFAKPIKDVTFQAVSVEQEIDEVLLLVGHDLKLEKIQVQKEIEPNLPNVLVDRRQFQEVLFNLIRNAGQAITPPGNIWIRAGVQGENVRIGIQDSGHGIPPDRLDKLFVPFFTTKEPGKGTGLGLFIVRQIVERNKGRISLESEVGKGTTFYLDFPITKPVLAVAGTSNK